MNDNQKKYEAPKMRIFQFSAPQNELTQSGAPNGSVQKGDYAASALNQLFEGTNTTVE